MRYGSLAGIPWAELPSLTGDPDIRKKDDNITFDYSKYGGDTAESLKHKVQKFVTETKLKYPKKTILVSTHGGVIDTMHILFPQEVKRETYNATAHEFIF